jgi:hypothetical protein
MRGGWRLRADRIIATSWRLIRSPRKMPAPPRKHRLGAHQRRALQFLAGTPFGATEASMFANGFARKTLVSLIGAGLATTQRENLKAVSRSLGRVMAGRSKVIESVPAPSQPRSGDLSAGSGGATPAPRPDSGRTT